MWYGGGIKNHSKLSKFRVNAINLYLRKCHENNDKESLEEAADFLDRYSNQIEIVYDLELHPVLIKLLES